MSTLMEDDIKRWTAKRKTALVLDIIQGKTTISEASRAFDLNPSEVEQWVDEGKRGMENALRTKPLEVKEQYEKQLRELKLPLEMGVLSFVQNVDKELRNGGKASTCGIHAGI